MAGAKLRGLESEDKEKLVELVGMLLLVERGSVVVSGDMVVIVLVDDGVLLGLAARLERPGEREVEVGEGPLGLDVLRMVEKEKVLPVGGPMVVVLLKVLVVVCPIGVVLRLIPP